MEGEEARQRPLQTLASSDAPMPLEQNQAYLALIRPDV